MSGLFTSVAVGAMGFACGALALSLAPSEPVPFVPPSRAPAVEPVVVPAREAPEIWPTVFGTIPEVAPEPELAPEPEVEPPPERNNSYLLTGVIAGPSIESFAMLSENDRGIVVRKGDTLVGGEVVTAIDAQGVWIEYNGATELIPVPETDFGTMVSLDTPDPETPEEDAEAAAGPASEFTFIIESLSLRSVEELVNGSGVIEPRDDRAVLVSVAQGMLFEKIGLQAGDQILTVNGVLPEGANLVANTPEPDLLRGALEFEILRDGARHMVKVTLAES
ncbi:MAG: hypothetical protein AAGP08_10930 [Pseudomonadota bacterium]